MPSEFNSWKELWYITLSTTTTTPPPPNPAQRTMYYRIMATVSSKNNGTLQEMILEGRCTPSFPEQKLCTAYLDI